MKESGVRMPWLFLAVASSLPAQTPAAPNTTPPSPLMSNTQMNQFCKRVTQLMEAGGVAIPDLQRASAPMIESAKQDCIQLEAKPGTSEPVFALMTSLRAYLALSDAIPKPFPFPEAAQRQASELRDNATRLDAYFLALLDSKEARLANPDRDNLRRYAESNRKIPPPDPSKPRVVFLGDSITDLWRLNEYFPDRDFVNRGIGGQITGEMLGRMKADVLDLHPAAVVILAGTNDLARSIPLTTIENNYLMIGDLLETYKIKIIFASVLPVSDYHRDVNRSYDRTPARPPIFIKALNEWIQGYCAQRHHYYLNYSAAMIDDTGQMQADLADDGLHPNAKGYRIMAPLALDAIQKTLAPPRVAPPQPQPQKPSKGRKTSN